jgi:hypothetical protein
VQIAVLNLFLGAIPRADRLIPTKTASPPEGTKKEPSHFKEVRDEESHGEKHDGSGVIIYLPKNSIQR